MLFGSEDKSFLDYPHFHKAVNKKALRPYMTLQYSATEETFFEGVYKLPPAHYFTVDIPTGKMNIERYWDCDYSAVEKPFEEYVDELDEVVHESVEAHRIADVKVASFLSGGVDSSYIAACLMPDKTFSVGFDYKNFNETNYAKELSDKLGVENVRKMITADEFFGALEDIQYHMDEPQSNLSSVPLWFLAEMARKDVTVVLSGEGADELFGRYAYYEDTVPVRKYKKMVPLPVRRALGNLALHMPYFKGHNFLVKGAEIPEKSFLGQALVWPEREVDGVLKPEYNTGDGAFELAAPIYARVKGQPELVKKQYLDMNMWLPGDILLKADKMCMAHSLELRVPFLDRKVMEFAEHIPDRYRINENGNKQVLRHAANKSLPDDWPPVPRWASRCRLSTGCASKSGTTMSRSTSPRRGQASSSIPTSSCTCSICTLRARAISSARSIRRSCSWCGTSASLSTGASLLFRLPSLGLRMPARNGSSGSRFCVGAFQLL